MSVGNPGQAMVAASEEVMSFCRKCGGDRHHRVLFRETINWNADPAPVDGGDTWSTLRCGGCHEVSFVHEHWFSEDYEITDEGPMAVIHRDVFPPAPRRKPLEQMDLIMFLKTDELWVVTLLENIYSAAGMGANALAAMGARAIIDHLVTSRSGLKANNFCQKATELERRGIISAVQKDTAVAAFDVGSAAAHRGHSPTESDFNILLDVTEDLLMHICILPGRTARQAADAIKLRANTPPRV